MAQTVTLRAETVARATLSFWLQIPEASDNATDRFSVTVDDTEVFHATGADSERYGSYTRVELDVTELLTGTHRLSFNASLAANSLARFYLDDVALQVAGAFVPPMQIYLPLLENAVSPDI